MWASQPDYLYMCTFHNYDLIQVNAKLQGKTALHIAAAEGFIHVLRALLEYGPNLNAQVHTCILCKAIGT